MMNLVIFGSRTLSGRKTHDVILSEIEKHSPDVIVTAGEPEGVCEVARKLAKRLSIPLKLHFVNNAKYAAGKYDHRSREVLKEGDFCIFIHDGTSKGTQNEMEIAKKFGKEFTYHLIEGSDSEVVDEDWEKALAWAN